MQFSKNWLKEFIDIKASTDQLCDQLTMLGLEVDNYKDFNSKLTGKDSIIKLDLTPNRGDCFSILGVARELSAANGVKLSYPKIKKVKETVESPLNVKVSKEAPSYIGRFITEIDLKKKTPPLIKERLKLSSVRLIDPIVDITNYVLLELGQPLHAFDSLKLAGNLGVRFAKNREEITLLDEEKIKLDSDCLVIADENKPVAFAGIMGSLHTGITSKTESVYLESAFFKPEVIRGKGRRFGIQTDASMRFERGVDFKIQTLAIEKASQLIKEITGGKFGPVQTFQKRTDLPKAKLISLNPLTASSVLGSSLKSTTITKILKSLGLEIMSSTNSHTIKVKVPSWRFDLEIESDLIEEIARMVGYDKLPQSNLKPVLRNKSDSLHQSLRSSFQFLGYNEAITYSFIDKEEAKLTDNEKNLISVKNPISQNMSVMRPSLLPGLLNTFSYNYNRGVEDLKIFEIGSVFHQKGKLNFSEDILVGGLMSGYREPINWSTSRTELDFYDLKGDIESIDSDLLFKQGNLPYLHPGKTALIFKGKKQLGYMGSLNPFVIEKLDLKQKVHFFELSLSSLRFSDHKKFRSFSNFPSAQRDLSFVIDNHISSKEVLELIKKKSGKELKDIKIFDFYEGKGIPKGKKSLAFSIFWQANNRTMTDLEIDKIVKKIVGFLSDKLDAKIRT
jgi:phenylalanyl-tRNA synthetase beta chain